MGANKLSQSHGEENVGTRLAVAIAVNLAHTPLRLTRKTRRIGIYSVQPKQALLKRSLRGVASILLLSTEEASSSSPSSFQPREE